MKNLKAIGLILELGGIVGLTVMTLKSEYDRHKAVTKMLNTEILNCALDIQHILDQAKIKALEKELEELKDKKDEKDESQ